MRGFVSTHFLPLLTSLACDQVSSLANGCDLPFLTSVTVTSCSQGSYHVGHYENDKAAGSWLFRMTAHILLQLSSSLSRCGSCQQRSKVAFSCIFRRYLVRFWTKAIKREWLKAAWRCFHSLDSSDSELNHCVGCLNRHPAIFVLNRAAANTNMQIILKFIWLFVHS